MHDSWYQNLPVELVEKPQRPCGTQAGAKHRQRCSRCVPQPLRSHQVGQQDFLLDVKGRYAVFSEGSHERSKWQAAQASSPGDAQPPGSDQVHQPELFSSDESPPSVVDACFSNSAGRSTLTLKLLRAALLMAPCLPTNPLSARAAPAPARLGLGSDPPHPRLPGSIPNREVHSVERRHADPPPGPQAGPVSAGHRDGALIRGCGRARVVGAMTIAPIGQSTAARGIIKEEVP